MSLIGVTAGLREGRVSIPGAYLTAILRQGDIPVLLAPGVAPPPGGIDSLDGLLLTGGVDVAPRLYRAERHPATDVDEERDALERPWAEAFVKAGKPIMAICRGLQVLSVVMGGTLVQHIPDLPGIAYDHSDPSALHPVAIKSRSLLEELLGTGEVSVNSSHHQALDRIAPGLAAIAWCDGLIEAVQSAQGAPILGVQWHPERMGAPMEPLFAWFSAQARQPMGTS